jgi:transposase
MHSKSAPRRRHSDELKAQVRAECDEPGASVAAVAQTHGLNANLVHKWRRTERAKSTATGVPQTNGGSAFIALQLPQASPTAVPDIRIELRRGATTVNIAWPGQTASECAAWLREWLR